MISWKYISNLNYTVDNNLKILWMSFWPKKVFFPLHKQSNRFDSSRSPNCTCKIKCNHNNLTFEKLCQNNQKLYSFKFTSLGFKQNIYFAILKLRFWDTNVALFFQHYLPMYQPYFNCFSWGVWKTFIVNTLFKRFSFAVRVSDSTRNLWERPLTYLCSVGD